MTHEEIQILISAYIDGETSPSEKNIVEEHLKTCTSCQNDYKKYVAISSSLSQWSDETLSPDEAFKVQKHLEKRREPMFTKHTLMALGTTLALAIIIGSTVQMYLKRGVQGRIKSAVDDIGNQFMNVQHQPVMLGNFKAAKAYYTYPLEEKTFILRNDRDVKSYNDSLYLEGAAVRGYLTPQLNALQPAMVPAPSYAQSPISPDRKIIKNADIALKVKNAENTQSLLEDLVTKYNGTIVSLNLERSDDNSRNGEMVLNVLPKDLDNFLLEVRKLGEVQSESQSASDITNQYTYLQTRLENDEAAKIRLRKSLDRNANDAEKSLYLEGRLAYLEDNINATENAIKNIDLQSYMATVTVHFYDTVKVVTPKEPNFQEKLDNSFRSNIKNTIQAAAEIGISSFSMIFIIFTFLLQVALWTLLFWGIFVVVRKFFKK